MSQISGNGFFPADGVNGTSSPWLARDGGSFAAGSPATARWTAGASSDGVRPAWFGGDAAGGVAASVPGMFNPYGTTGIVGILSQLAATVQQYIGKLGNALLGSQSPGTSGTTTTAASGAATFQNVALGSTGDPHLSVSGTIQNADGTTAQADSHFDSMTAHANLFSSRDFGDNFTVSTAVTQPSANGITQNASATASMSGGSDSVTMNANGSVSVTSGGMSIALAPNQTVQLAGGASVAEAADGAVSISETAFGANLTTTFTANGGGGVDVTANGSNVTLAGDLLTGGTTPAAQVPSNVRRPLVAMR